MVTPILAGTRVRAAAVVGIVTFLVLTGTGAASAHWTTTQNSVGASATSASLQLAVAGDLNGQYSFAGAPSTNPAGAYVTRVVTVTNNSTVPLASNFSVSLSRSSGTVAGADVLAWITAKSTTTCPNPTTGGTPLGSTVTYTAPTGSTVAAGASVDVCVSTKLNTTTAANAGRSIVLSLAGSGAFSAAWTVTAPAVTATQTVALAKPAVTCANGSGFGLTLSWTAQPGTTYDVYDNNGGLVATNVASGALFTYADGSGYEVGAGVTSLTLMATVGSASVSSNAVPIRSAGYLIFFTTVRCNPVGTY